MQCVQSVTFLYGCVRCITFPLFFQARDTMKLIGALWSTLTFEDKKPFEQRSQELVRVVVSKQTQSAMPSSSQSCGRLSLAHTDDGLALNLTTVVSRVTLSSHHDVTYTYIQHTYIMTYNVIDRLVHKSLLHHHKLTKY